MARIVWENDQSSMNTINSAWKLSKYGVFSGPYFPVFGLNTEIYSVDLRVQSVFLEILQNSLENICARASFLVKLQAWGLQLY